MVHRRVAWEATKTSRSFITPTGLDGPHVTIVALMNDKSARHEIQIEVIGRTTENFGVTNMVFADMAPVYEVVEDALTVAAFSWSSAVLASAAGRHKNAVQAILAISEALKKPRTDETSSLKQDIEIALDWHGFVTGEAETSDQPEAKKE